jgi:hypothetical protein
MSAMEGGGAIVRREDKPDDPKIGPEKAVIVLKTLNRVQMRGAPETSL